LFSGSRKYVDSICATLIGAETIKATQIRPLHAAIALFSVVHLNYTDTYYTRYTFIYINIQHITLLEF